MRTALPRIAAALLALIAGAVVLGVWSAIGLDVNYFVDLLLVASIIWLALDRVTVHERVDEAADAADLARGKAEAIENHLTGLEPPSAGRHSKSGDTPRYEGLRR